MKYFEDFLKSKPMSSLPNLSFIVEALIVEEENVMICRVPSMEEVKDAIFVIPIDSSPGPDGFGAGFLRSCWDIVKVDVMDAVNDFFSGKSFPRFYSVSSLVLIPKVDNPTSFDKFRPISLCSVIYKVCSKILVQRLNHIFSILISPE